VRGFLGGSSEGLGLDVVSSWWRRRWIFGFDIEIGGSLWFGGQFGGSCWNNLKLVGTGV
jgi:hypothetical protein